MSSTPSEVGAGRLDAAAVRHVLEAGGGGHLPVRASHPGGLTDREVAVLVLIARGYTNRRVGEKLYISPKTVSRHVENVYGKLGVSTRPGATLFATENGLLG